jgi:arginine N-succinyltransferase
MLLLRDVAKSDLPSLKRLASVLNTVNLPNNEAVLRKLIETSVQSFQQTIADATDREYLFVLEDPEKKSILGTSMVIAQHGTLTAPHIFFQVTDAEHYSASIDRHFRHKVLSIGYNYDGPTEIGGLVVDPPSRSGPEKPGKQLSYVRFLFMSMDKSLFRERVLAELMPPLMEDGRSLLWESIGKKFTGLEYPEADKLSRQNKEFIKELFPASDIYVSLFPQATQKLIGEVGPETRGVQRMLERIGFSYVNHIDPFDGGPHYEATLSEVSLVRKFRTASVHKTALEHDGEEVLVGLSRDSKTNRFRAVRCQVRFDDQTVLLPKRAKELLRVKTGDKVHVVPFE